MNELNQIIKSIFHHVFARYCAPVITSEGEYNSFIAGSADR